MYHDGFVVPPLSKRDIHGNAAAIRTRLARVLGPGPKVPIDQVYELMPMVLPGFSLEICSEGEMDDDHGRTYPNKRLIQLREDVYDRMCRGVGRDRFTGAHELGHLFLHANVPLARRAVRDSATTVPAYMNSEWQADTFASALLIDERQLAGMDSPEEVMRIFGVTHSAACYRLKATRK